ncbi:NUDIX hydrolase [Dactylosporangium aurantiacum]|uniref:NUDIX hydrolase n=1 Tax=Dactylosporangium aurantiacum TaxID=35754 RepID=A0A9Q9MG67_9ACTN|nr:NUDIX domain-containing protein [Dactylosporangium aurantiacum]MDG6102267.1 NUDIX domain-containing protein [Dactylosporangium aurantiacum]UWZ53425.1 NUDIX hydrolase [Dactylosporangium aurantiacum]
MTNHAGRAATTLTVDLVVLTVRYGTLHVLLIERGNEPFRGQLALPGGFVRAEEDLDDTAARELTEETGLDAGRLYFEQLRTYATPGRDPRGRVVTVAYLAIQGFLPEPSAGTDAADAHWRPVEPFLTGGGLAFDHDAILCDAVERARAKLEYTTVATAFCPPQFTIGDLRQVYEVVWGQPVDPRNFHRKVLGAEGFLEATGQQRLPETGRPANLYRRGPATVLTPPMLRPQPQARPR